MTTKDTLALALEALEESIDDVRTCLNEVKFHAGYPKYDRQIAAYEAQIVKHEAAITAIKQAQDEGVCKGAWEIGTACGTCSKCIATKPQAQQAQEPVNCGCCNGTGWVVRDPDIGTDQECFCCNGSGKAEIQTAPKQAEPAWQPIGTAPIGTSMFVVRGFNVDVSDRIRNYTTDPYGVWQPTLGRFERWPHPFAPTHWLPLPTPPEAA